MLEISPPMYVDMHLHAVSCCQSTRHFSPKDVPDESIVVAKWLWLALYNHLFIDLLVKPVTHLRAA
jgi:hypothetical protein